MVRKKVLVAQEDAEMLNLIRVNLREAGYDAIPAQDGVAAYEAVEGTSPMAIILDLNLPRMSGFRLVKLIRRNPRWRSIPLIVTSAYAFEEIEELANEGVDAFVTRPFTPSDLMNRLEHLLSRRTLAIAS